MSQYVYMEMEYKIEKAIAYPDSLSNFDVLQGAVFQPGNNQLMTELKN